jgi:hypothetical protein
VIIAIGEMTLSFSNEAGKPGAAKGNYLLT